MRGRTSCLLPTCPLLDHDLRRCCVPGCNRKPPNRLPSAAQVLKQHRAVQEQRCPWGTLAGLFITVIAKTLKWRNADIYKHSKGASGGTTAASQPRVVGPAHPPWEDHTCPLLAESTWGSEEPFTHSQSRKGPNLQPLLSQVPCVAVPQSTTPSTG